MFNMPTGGELLIIVLVALLVLGPDRIPEVARNLGRAINRFKEMTAGFQKTVEDISDDPSMKPLKDLGELAARPRQKLAEFAAEAEAEERAQRLASERSEREEIQAQHMLAAAVEEQSEETQTDSDQSVETSERGQEPSEQ